MPSSPVEPRDVFFFALSDGWIPRSPSIAAEFLTGDRLDN